MKAARLLAAAMVAAIATSNVTACASSGAGNTSTSPKPTSRDKVTKDEITGTPASTAYDLVYHLRPDWLRARGTASMVGGSEGSGAPLVYLDGVKMGGLDALKSISSREIQSMEWIPGAKAELVLSDVGSRAIVGAIALKTR
jgi:hypothetical protein